MKVKGFDYDHIHEMPYQGRVLLQREQGKHRRRQRREMRERFAR